MPPPTITTSASRSIGFSPRRARAGAVRACPRRREASGSPPRPGGASAGWPATRAAGRSRSPDGTRPRRTTPVRKDVTNVSWTPASSPFRRQPGGRPARPRLAVVDRPLAANEVEHPAVRERPVVRERRQAGFVLQDHDRHSAHLRLQRRVRGRGGERERLGCAPGEHADHESVLGEELVDPVEGGEEAAAQAGRSDRQVEPVTILVAAIEVQHPSCRGARSARRPRSLW